MAEGIENVDTNASTETASTETETNTETTSTENQTETNDASTTNNLTVPKGNEEQNTETASTETGSEGNATENEGNEQGEDVDGNAEFDYSKYENEFIETGDIGEESKEELYKVFPKNLVDNYISNMKLASEQVTAQAEKRVFDVAGGEKNYMDMVTWASKNMSKDEIKDYDNAVTGGDSEKATLAIKALKAQYELAQTKTPNIQMGGASNGTENHDVFLTREGYAKAVASDEYENNAEFRAEIDNKLARTLKYGGFTK